MVTKGMLFYIEIYLLRYIKVLGQVLMIALIPIPITVLNPIKGYIKKLFAAGTNKKRLSQKGQPLKHNFYFRGSLIRLFRKL